MLARALPKCTPESLVQVLMTQKRGSAMQFSRHGALGRAPYNPGCSCSVLRTRLFGAQSEGFCKQRSLVTSPNSARKQESDHMTMAHAYIAQKSALIRLLSHRAHCAVRYCGENVYLANLCDSCSLSALSPRLIQQF